jgi:ADP-ribose pyrophosphatase YjhB (NUDIX family)
MSDHEVPRWLEWAREIQSLGQTGLTYSETPYDTQRYTRLMELAAEMVEANTGLPSGPTMESFRLQPGYATPKVDVRGAVVRDGNILLVRERRDGLWCMPGGWADVGETPSEMVEREVWEESGFEVVARKVVGVYDANRSGRPLSFFHAYKIVFLCDIQGGEARPSDETSAVDFFPFDQLPPLSKERTHERHLKEVLAHVREPQRPVAFD